MTNTAHKNRMTTDGKMSFAPRELAPPPADLAGQINALIDDALVVDVERQKPRAYLGGSRVGLECHRQLAYEYEKSMRDAAAWEDAATVFMAAEKPPVLDHRTPHTFPGRIIRRFRVGHWCEGEGATLLRMAGFTLHTERASGAQFGWGTAPDPETGENRMKGHIDGIIEAGPIPLPYPLQWEHKVMKHSKWTDTDRKGVQKVHPIYYYQMQTYMAYMDFTNTLFTAYDSDTSELLVELVPFNQADAQWATDRAVRVLQAKEPEELPRVSSDPSFYLCKWCPFSERCWEEPIKIDRTPLPYWLNKK